MRNGTRALVIALAILLVGSSPAGASVESWPCVVTVSIDAGPLHRIGVSALRQLDDATRLRFNLVSGEAMVAVHWVHPKDRRAAGVAAGVVGEHVEIEIDPNLASGWRLHVALHELGHAAGLGHSDDPLSVMRPGYDDGGVPWKHYGPNDLAALAAIGCG